MRKSTNNPAPRNERTHRLARIGLVAAVVALAMSAAPLLGVGADAALDKPTFCVGADGYDNTFHGHAGGVACNAPAVEPVTVPETVLVNWSAPFSRFATGYDLIAVDDLSKEERQIGATDPGSPLGMAYLPTSGKSTGWTLELRSGSTPVARASVLPKEVETADDGGWVHGDATVKFKPLPITVDYGTTLYAEQENATGTPTVGEFAWKISDQDGELVDRGEGKTSEGVQSDLIRISKSVVVASPKQIGEVSSGELPKWSVEYTYQGKAYSTPLSGFDYRGSDESQMVAGPTHLKGYTLSYNGTRLLLRAGQPDSEDRIRAELY